ncbi:hypothetical protein BV22DRAFT_1011677 [Leucogyrophana mollusca]|uniref:Uncharacterized protein n=1 Tax=Leucogyrophana mollusca TaxID=85980 RepID=A0ACB8BK40_9AGAM|nr:hypothetical protein BV22DRAFT_1011677 [Leucogyrophana mollusca]
MSSPSPPTLPGPRRIVTAYNEDGKAIARVDDLDVPGYDVPGMDGIRSGCYWATTDGMPTNDNNTTEDGATRQIGDYGLIIPGATNFRYTDLGPGVCTPMHRTPSVDYNILSKPRASWRFHLR